MEDAFEGRGDMMILSTSLSGLKIGGARERVVSSAARRELHMKNESNRVWGDPTTSRNRNAKGEARDIFGSGYEQPAQTATITTTPELKYTPSRSARASLLGLPAELRLRIYDFVLVPKASTDVKDSAHHCCSTMGSRQRFTDVPASGAICNCVGTVPTATLRASKMIFAEAMPVLYQNTEICLTMPICGQYGIIQDHADIVVQLMRLPRYGREHVRKVLVSCFCADISELAPIMARRFCVKIKTYLPATRHVRLHIEVARRVSFDDPTSPCFDGLADIATLPKLETIQTEASGRCNHVQALPHGGLLQLRQRRQLLVATIESKAKGKKVKVVDRTQESQAEASELLRPIEHVLKELHTPTTVPTPTGMKLIEYERRHLFMAGRHIRAICQGTEISNAEAIESAMWDYISEYYWIGSMDVHDLKSIFEASENAARHKKQRKI